MKFRIKVKPYAAEDKIQKLPDGSFLVHVKAPPADGKANEKVIEVLSEYFKRPKQNIKIRSGFTGRHKIVEVE